MWALNNLFGGTGAEVDYYSLGGKVHFVQLLSHPPFSLNLQGMPKETIGTLHAD